MAADSAVVGAHHLLFPSGIGFERFPWNILCRGPIADDPYPPRVEIFLASCEP